MQEQVIQDLAQTDGVDDLQVPHLNQELLPVVTCW